MGWPDSAIVCHAISNGLHSQGCTPRTAHPDLQGLSLTPRPAISNGLYNQGCTPGPSRPLLDSQASKALTTAQPARPLLNTQTSKASSKHPDQQGLF